MILGGLLGAFCTDYGSKLGHFISARGQVVIFTDPI